MEKKKKQTTEKKKQNMNINKQNVTDSIKKHINFF